MIQYVVTKRECRGASALRPALLSQETQQVKTLLTRRCQRSRFYWCAWKYTFLLMISNKTIWKGQTMFPFADNISQELKILVKRHKRFSSKRLKLKEIWETISSKNCNRSLLEPRNDHVFWSITQICNQLKDGSHQTDQNQDLVSVFLITSETIFFSSSQWIMCHVESRQQRGVRRSDASTSWKWDYTTPSLPAPN